MVDQTALEKLNLRSASTRDVPSGAATVGVLGSKGNNVDLNRLEVQGSEKFLYKVIPDVSKLPHSRLRWA